MTVGVKLSIIAGLLFGLRLVFRQKVNAGELVVNPGDSWRLAGNCAHRVCWVTVQGFETSRYIGDE